MEESQKTSKEAKGGSRKELFRSKRASSSTQRATHPFVCRLRESEAISLSTPESLMGAGFASVALAMFTFFRTTPGLLIMFTKPQEKDWDYSLFSRELLWLAMGCWLAVIYIVLFFFGIVLVCSVLVRKRRILMLHPWGLMLLYFDIFVWLAILVFLQLRMITWPNDCPKNTGKSHPLIYFVIMYIECALFGALYYFYATFFIAAELTIIEKHFP